jgi:hypothetical protein
MTARIIPLRPVERPSKRVDALARAMTPRGPQESFLTAHADVGAVRLDVGCLEVWSSPAEVREFAREALAAADEAERRAGK